MRTQLATIAALACSIPAYADDVTYQRPVPAVANFVDAPPIPQANRRAHAEPDRAEGGNVWQTANARQCRKAAVEDSFRHIGALEVDVFL